MRVNIAVETSAHPLDAVLTEHVHSVLERYLARRRRDVQDVHPPLVELTEALCEFVLGGGKRIRPTCAWWGWRGCGGDPDGTLVEPVLTAISALELLQTTALVHDDVIDASALRRGRPAVHVSFAARHRRHAWRGESDRFGQSAALLLGDLALAWADDLIAEAALPEPIATRLRTVWAAMRSELVAGQFLDILGQASGDNSAAHALRVSRFKSAAYTVERPLQLGAVMAGAPRSTVVALRRFGVEVGVAFQLRDDLLGVFGDPAETGKPAGDDLREGKRTLLTAIGIERARDDPAGMRVLTTALGDPDLDAEGVNQVRQVLCELGVPDEVEKRIVRHTQLGLARLAEAGLEHTAANKLRELARRVTTGPR